MPSSLFPDLLKPMPPIAWISISILWFGIGETSKIFILVVGYADALPAQRLQPACAW